MKFLLAVLLILSLFSCRKNIEQDLGSQLASTVSNDALAPLPCHSTSFVTNYAIKPGEVPPFRFTKTLYSDTRVKSINMLSRVYPVHPAYKKHAYELIGTFTYSTNAAKFVGTRELWEYYKTAAGGAGKRSLGKRSLVYTFGFDHLGQCYYVATADGSTYLNISYDYFKSPLTIESIWVSELSGSGDKYYQAITDSRGNVLTYDTPFPEHKYLPNIIYSYDYTQPSAGKSFNYIPSQNLISQEFSLLEVMQWVPYRQENIRKTVSAVFYPYKSSYKVTQTQTYKNHKFDIKGNLLSYTYADNVLQKTIWYCK